MRVTLKQPVHACEYCVSFHSHIGAIDFEAYLKSEPTILRCSIEGNMVRMLSESVHAGDNLLKTYEEVALNRQEQYLKIMNSSKDASVHSSNL